MKVFRFFIQIVRLLVIRFTSLRGNTQRFNAIDFCLPKDCPKELYGIAKNKIIQDFEGNLDLRLKNFDPIYFYQLYVFNQWLYKNYPDLVNNGDVFEHKIKNHLPKVTKVIVSKDNTFLQVQSKGWASISIKEVNITNGILVPNDTNRIIKIIHDYYKDSNILEVVE